MLRNYRYRAPLITGGLAAAALAAMGCSSSSERPQHFIPEPPERILYGPSQNFVPQNEEGSGAVIVGPNYEHHVWPRVQGSADRQMTMELLSDPDQDPDQMLLSGNHYDMLLLDRYCAGGQDLTQPEYLSITVTDLAALSEVYDFQGCQPPRYSYADYVSAYTALCTEDAGALSERDESVVDYFGGPEMYPETLFDECTGV